MSRRIKPHKVRGRESGQRCVGRTPAADEGAAGPDEQACEWRTRLLRNEKGSARDCVANAVLILRSDARFIGRLRLDELHQATFACNLPWNRSCIWRPWSDVDDIELAHWCQLRGVILKPATCAAAVQMVASHHRHHAVRGYLENLCWDGKPRWTCGSRPISAPGSMRGRSMRTLAGGHAADRRAKVAVVVSHPTVTRLERQCPVERPNWCPNPPSPAPRCLREPSAPCQTRYRRAA